MKSTFPRQRVVLLTMLYCFAAALVCGVWSTRSFGSSSVTYESDASLLSSSEIWRAGARSLTSTKEKVDDEELLNLDMDVPGGDLQSSLPQLYHTPEVFALNYKEMSENLRVFIYPNTDNASYEYDVTSDAPVSGSGSDVRFVNLLAKTANVFVTKDPEEAHLFYLPVSFDALITKLGPDGAGQHLREYLQAVRDSFTFWDRSLGADHFYLSTGAYEYVNHRNNLEFTKNAIQVASSPLQPQQFFYPHKDIALPSYRSAGYQSSESQRSHLAHVGNLQSPTPSEWGTDDAFQFESAGSDVHAKFCVMDSVRSVVDALRAGCVPVLVSDSLFYDLPFQDILNWHEFAVVIGTSEMANLKTVLTTMPDGKYEKMQYLGRQASKHMEWNDPPAAYDAFHMSLFQLWMRRHSVKYARRSDS